MGSILLAREVPDEGGDTLFSNMYRAYDALSDGLPTDSPTACAQVHSAEHVFGEKSTRNNPEWPKRNAASRGR